MFKQPAAGDTVAVAAAAAVLTEMRPGDERAPQCRHDAAGCCQINYVDVVEVAFREVGPPHDSASSADFSRYTKTVGQSRQSTTFPEHCLGDQYRVPLTNAKEQIRTGQSCHTARCFLESRQQLFAISDAAAN